MTSPTIVVLHDHPDELTRALRRRFGRDYLVSAARTIPQFEELLGQHTTALVIVDRAVAGRSVLDALQALRDTAPDTVRCVLSPAADRVTTQRLLAAVDAGAVDRCLPTPWGHPDVGLHPQVSDMLAQWWRATAPDAVAVPQLTIVAATGHARLAELRDIADRNNVPTRFLTPDDPAGRQILRDGNAAADSLVVTAEGKRPLRDPTTAQIGGLVGARLQPEHPHCDLAIVGAGPAGLAAAVFGASEGLSTVVLEPKALGGQAGTSSSIRNYPGFPYGINGGDLATLLAQQAWLLGAQTVYRTATTLHPGGAAHRLDLEGGSQLTADAVLLATGVRYRRLDIPGVERLIGAGVYYGAARAEAPRCSRQDVVVVGGGNSAGQAATHLAQHARRVTLVVRGASPGASMSDYLVRQIGRTRNIDVRVGSRITAAHGSTQLETLTIERSGDAVTVPASALFVMIGAEPDTGWLPAAIARDAEGFLLTGGAARPRNPTPLPYETTVEGVFAIGDVRHGSMKRVASAVGEGATSVSSVHARLAIRQGRAASDGA